MLHPSALPILCSMQGVSGGKVSILGGHSIGHVYVHVTYSERFPRYSYFTIHCTDSLEFQSALMLTAEIS
jgi:hypothetical protein